MRIHLVYAGATTAADLVTDWFSGLVDGAQMPKGGRELALGLVR